MANKYRLQSAPEATLDGSGNVAHDICGIDSENNVIPGRHQTVNIPEDDVDIIMAMPDGTAAEKQSKNAAYKALIADNLPSGWTNDDLQEIVDNNSQAATSAEAINDYITVTLGQEYPVDFNLG